MRKLTGLTLLIGMVLVMGCTREKAEKPCEPISQEQIDTILERVANTEVEPVAENEVAVLETSKGAVVIDFFPELAPRHCQSFKRLVTAGYFDCTYFHRVIDGFVIQGGDILTRDENKENDGTGGPGYTVPAEFNDTPHDLGIVSMARSQDPNSAGSQFFICLSREGTKMLDDKYTVFGKVVEGLDVVQEIGKVETKTNRFNEKSVPVEPIYILNAKMATR